MAPTSMGISDAWARIKQELTGIQLMWLTLNGLFSHADRRPGLARLTTDLPLLSGLLQTSMLESLLLRVARLMDPSQSGRSGSHHSNLSLNALCLMEPSLQTGIAPVYFLWDASNLKELRDKYLAHNDQQRAQQEPHSVSLPVTSADLAALSELIDALHAVRTVVHSKLGGAPYLDRSLRLGVEREIDVLNHCWTLALNDSAAPDLEPTGEVQP